MLDASVLPSWIVLQLIERCNLRCSMCYEWGDQGTYAQIGGRRELDADRVIELIRECAEQRPHYEFFGGEPLLYKPLAPILRALAESGSPVSFSTNGWLLAARAEELLAHPPRRIWVSIDGPRAVNDAQRGSGVFDRAIAGIQRLAELRGELALPEIAVTTIVTPQNWSTINREFAESLPHTHLRAWSIEMCCYATPEQLVQYRARTASIFGVSKTPYADAYQSTPDAFARIDCEQLALAIDEISDFCRNRGIELNLQPRRPTAANLQAYFRGEFQRMDDARSRCAVPWIAAEINAGGEVSTCHSFYDITLGNIHEHTLREIWQSDRARRWRAHLRRGLLPICTACCRYHGA